MTKPKPPSPSRIPVTIPFRQHPFNKPTDDNLHCKSAEASNLYFEHQSSSTFSAVSVPALQMDTKIFLPGHMSFHGSVGRHSRADCHSPYGESLAPNLVNHFPPMSYGLAAQSVGPFSHHQLTNDDAFEPRMMCLNYDPVLWDNLPAFHDRVEDPGFAFTTSSEMPNQQQQQHDYSSQEMHDNYLEWSKPVSEASISSPEDEMEDPVDKPYARLIYEALMQAPGHRMMLRDIYDWFAENTCKTQGSSVNGWQNSIRHNLSMNQAFENDKSDQNGCRPGRKANSIWFLTEDAIENGVQSTTRFRKTGPPKRGHNQRNNQTLRQRSGMKGGKATKRSLALRRQGSTPAHQCAYPPKDECSPSYHGDFDETLSHATCYAGNHPMTPAQDLMYEHVYGLPQWDSSENMQHIKRETTPTDAKEYLHCHSMDTLCGDLTALQHDSLSFGHVYI